MKRFRLSTLMLLIVIAALIVALVLQHRREAELQARLAQSWPLFQKKQAAEERIKGLELELKLKQEELTYSSILLQSYNAKVMQLRSEAEAQRRPK